MAMFLNPNNMNFKETVSSNVYVDKTGLIEYTNSVISTTSKFICNSRPRRFGKSMTADMLCAYYSKGCDSKELFMPYHISSSPTFEKYLNQYDVIRIDVQACIALSKGVFNVVDYIENECIQELKETYSNYDLLRTDTLLGVLHEVHMKTGNQFVVIIDEWDVLFRDYKNQTIQNQYLDFLRSIFKNQYASECIALAYLTGILPIKKTQTQSALNNFDEYTMLNPGPLAPYFGFTEKEVQYLCQDCFSEVKKWYDGYLLGNEHVYNPKAVVSYLNFHILQSYWTQTSSYESINSLIKMNFDGLKDAIIQMLSGSQVEVRTTTFQNDMISFKNKDDVLTALVHLGYLGYNQTYRTVFIPNEEIRQEFVNSVSEDKWNDLILFEKESSKILDATLDLDEETVAIGIEKIHNTYASNITYHNENSLSCVLTLAYLSTLKYYFKPIRELPTGRGFADFVYIPKPEYKEYYPALLVELKWNQNVQSALDQIQNKEYPQSIQDYTENLLLIGINYDKKTKKHIVKIRH